MVKVKNYKRVKMKITPIVLISTVLLLVGCTAKHGAFKTTHERDTMVWDQSVKQWTSVEQFWQNYANTSSGVNWGKGLTYPSYHEVKEGDTFVIVSNQGPCLMEFYHNRWRRANDVNRWNDQMNNYGGCPVVFD